MSADKSEGDGAIAVDLLHVLGLSLRSGELELKEPVFHESIKTTGSLASTSIHHFKMEVRLALVRVLMSHVSLRLLST